VCEIKEIKDNVIDKMNLVVDLFLARSQMLRTHNGKSVHRLIPTRFLSAVIVAERLLELRTSLALVADSAAYKTFTDSAKADVKTQCE
jgi:hypothetical protein